MKKLIIAVVLLITANLSAQVTTPDFKTNHLIIGTVEINGHESKEKLIFKATLEGIEIIDKDKKQYQVRKCGKDKCKIIHLEFKSTGISLIQGWHTTTPNNIYLNNNN